MSFSVSCDGTIWEIDFFFSTFPSNGSWLSPWRWDVLISLTNCQWDYAQSLQLVFSSCVKCHLPETQVCVDLTEKAMRSEPQSLMLKSKKTQSLNIFNISS